MLQQSGSVSVSSCLHPTNRDNCGPKPCIYFYGDTPTAGLIFDKAGNLYGTTQNGGTYEHGIRFRLKQSAGHGRARPTTWTETIVHSFSAKSGSVPWAVPTFGVECALYRTASEGGYHIKAVCVTLPAVG